MAKSHFGRPCQHSQTVSDTVIGLRTQFRLFYMQTSVFACVQDVVSLFGSQKEGEFGSAACYLPGFGKVCGQWPNGKKLAALLFISLPLWSSSSVDFILVSLRVTRCQWSKRISWKVRGCSSASRLQPATLSVPLSQAPPLFVDLERFDFRRCDAS